MNWDMLDTIAAYGALSTSMCAILWTWWAKQRASTSADVERIRDEVLELRSFRDKLEGADWHSRLRDIEQRQRDSETSMARVEQRLESIDSLLCQISSTVQQIATRGSDE